MSISRAITVERDEVWTGKGEQGVVRVVKAFPFFSLDLCQAARQAIPPHRSGEIYSAHSGTGVGVGVFG